MQESPSPLANPATFGRRQACAWLGAGLLTLALTACSGFKARELKPGEKHFWDIDRHSG
jgi:hypothetical protein